MREMAAEWQADGNEDDVEIWSVGHPNSSAILSYYVMDATSPVFEDVENATYSAYALYGVRQDDLVILGRDGTLQHHLSTIEQDLRTPSPRDLVDGWVRDLLAR